LVENFGFCLDHGQNPYSSWKIRVNIGVNPSGEIEDIEELLPPQAVLNDKENIDKLTEIIAVQSYHTSDSLFEYMRSTMTTHYEEMDGTDHEYLMLSCPRVINFEQLVIEWSLKLLERLSEDELFKRSTI